VLRCAARAFRFVAVRLAAVLRRVVEALRCCVAPAAVPREVLRDAVLRAVERLLDVLRDLGRLLDVLRDLARLFDVVLRFRLVVFFFSAMFTLSLTLLVVISIRKDTTNTGSETRSGVTSVTERVFVS
jgi:hypothetical protein